MGRTWSSSRGRSSMFRLYLKPEHPPGSTLTRSPATAGSTCSASMNFSTSSTARGVRMIWIPVVLACSSTVLIVHLLGVPQESYEDRRTGSTLHFRCQKTNHGVGDRDPEGKDSGIVPGGVDPVGQQDDDQAAPGVGPHAGAGESGVAVAPRAKQGSGAASGRGCIPSQGAGGARHDVLATHEFPGDLGAASHLCEQPLPEAQQIERTAKQAGVPRNSMQPGRLFVMDLAPHDAFTPGRVVLGCGDPGDLPGPEPGRSEERRVGKECRAR